GIKREKDVDRSQSIAPMTGRKLDRMIIGILVVLVAYLLIDKLVLQEPATTQIPVEAQVSREQDTPSPAIAEAAANEQSVAVLPFVSMSSGEDDTYFADGLTEEILNSLARLPELLVTARTSSFHFKGKDLPIPEIAKTLGVDHVVEGSVRRSGDRVRITAQLIRAEDGFHLWSDTYDRTLKDVFAVQEDIAENIADTLDVVLSEDKRQKMRDARISDVEAFIAYQKAMEAFGEAHSISEPIELLGGANKWFDKALETAPQITSALYLRSDLYGHKIYDNASNLRTFGDAELHEAMLEIRTSLDKAWQSAGNDSQRAILDAERTMLSNNWTGLKEKLDKAFQPGDCMPINWLTSVGANFGWAEQIAAHERNQLRCDPLRPLPAVMLTMWEIWNGNAAEAVNIANKHERLLGFNPWLDDIRFYALLASDQYRDDPNIFNPNPEGSIFQIPRSIFAYAKNGDINQSRKVLDNWRSEHEVDDLSMVLVEAAFGNREAANDYASRIDARIGGTLVLTEIVKTCLCGAPFDLDATPTFKKRMEEAGFNWPPASPIQYPAKDW
ncbi:hypothetical protein ACFL3I_04545, partial [Pseudomonadota bacterium]